MSWWGLLSACPLFTVYLLVMRTRHGQGKRNLSAAQHPLAADYVIIFESAGDTKHSIFCGWFYADDPDCAV